MKILKILEWSDETKFRTFIYNVFYPFFYILEKIAFKRLWINLCKEEIFTDDNVMDFFDRNEFGFVDEQIYKKDIITDKNMETHMSLTELEFALNREWQTAVAQILSENIPLSLEDHLQVVIELSVLENGINQYSVYIRYNRYVLVFGKKKKFIIISLLYLIMVLIAAYFVWLF